MFFHHEYKVKQNFNLLNGNWTPKSVWAAQSNASFTAFLEPVERSHRISALTHEAPHVSTTQRAEFSESNWNYFAVNAFDGLVCSQVRTRLSMSKWKTELCIGRDEGQWKCAPETWASAGLVAEKCSLTLLLQQLQGFSLHLSVLLCFSRETNLSCGAEKYKARRMLKDMLQGSRWDCASLYKSTSDNPRLNEAKVLGLWLCWEPGFRNDLHECRKSFK